MAAPPPKHALRPPPLSSFPATCSLALTLALVHALMHAHMHARSQKKHQPRNIRTHLLDLWVDAALPGHGVCRHRLDAAREAHGVKARLDGRRDVCDGLQAG
jgi:hypothetical protein